MSNPSRGRVQSFRHKVRKISNQLSNDAEFHAYLESEKRRKEFEKLDLEECRCIFLTNKTQMKGRRNAITEEELRDQMRKVSLTSLKSKVVRKISGNDKDEWELEEIKKIVQYQTHPKRTISP